MKTTEQKQKEVNDYFKNCEKHLFTIYAEHKTYYHVYSVVKDDVQHRIALEFKIDSDKAHARVYRMTDWMLKANYSAQYFTQREQAKSVRQNKHLKAIISQIKETLFEQIQTGKSHYYLDMPILVKEE